MGPIVKILQGSLEGTEGKDLDGNEFYKFLGIPYAKAPVGHLRFKEPQQLDGWIGVRDATKDGSCCYQKDEVTKQFDGSEDCLYLNVYTRELPSDKYNLKPVMVWIHGGAFTSGSNSSNFYGPEFLITQDVVLVSINYRLGLLGFLRIKDTGLNVSGNMGLKDQVEALRWVKTNIQQFNGDPDNVTLFGESAGAASVHYHVLSPLSRGLFHKAIMQSAAALNPWCNSCDHSVVQIVKILDSTVSTEKEALQILKNISVEKMLELQLAYLAVKMHYWRWKIARLAVLRTQENVFVFTPSWGHRLMTEKQDLGRALIGPVIESFTAKSAFLSKSPIDIISSGEYNKIPLIFGYNDNEGLLFSESLKAVGDERRFNIENYLPHNVNLKKNPEVKRNLVEKLQNIYFTGTNQDDNVSMLISDAWFIAGVTGSVKNHSLTSAYPVYLYKMSLDTELNLAKKFLKASHIPGCSHADDLGYLFKSNFTPPIMPGSTEEKSLRRIIHLWANFARSGNPTPDAEEFGLIWKPAMARQLNTLHIAENMQMKINPEGKRMDLWRQIYHQDKATMKYL